MKRSECIICGRPPRHHLLISVQMKCADKKPFPQYQGHGLFDDEWSTWVARVISCLHTGEDIDTNALNLYLRDVARKLYIPLETIDQLFYECLDP